MKNTALILALCFSAVFGELINNNPDPNGDPWYSGGWKQPGFEEMEYINSLPKLQLNGKYRTEKLPYAVDNSQLQFFRPVFNQQGGSCAQASGVGYIYTYEMNFSNNTSADLEVNQFPSHYTYNFLNDGSGANGSTYFGGWEIINAGGIPTVSTYGGMWPSTDLDTMYKIWMSGFDKYSGGMDKRMVDVFAIPVGTEAGIETLKQYFNDHLDGSEYGGIVNFSAGVSYTFSQGVLPTGTENAGQRVVLNWDPSVNHAMTFAGYNDSIRWDVNADGKYTNDIDITGDGIVDVRDWEVGGVLMVNSWGDSWGTEGKAWVLYRTLALELEEGGIWQNSVFGIKVRDDFAPTLKMKAEINYSDRKELKIYAGVASDTTAAVPEHTVSFPHFNNQGGADTGMNGITDNIEIGLDVSPLLSFINSTQPAKFFLCVEQMTDGSTGRGNIASFSIIDENGNEFSNSETIDINRDTVTYSPVTASVEFNAPAITDDFLPEGEGGIFYQHPLTAVNGYPPYEWDILFEYNETENTDPFPALATEQLTMTNEDDGIAVIDLDFPFPFYGVLFDSITVSTDGSFLFDNNFEYVRSEADIAATWAITPYGADLMSVPGEGHGIWYYMDNDLLEVRWISSRWDNTEAYADFAARIYRDGTVRFFYGDGITEGLDWACGISNGDISSASFSEISGINAPSNMSTGFSTDPYPYGLELSQDGIFSGTIGEYGAEWNINFRVTDDRNVSSIKELIFSTASGIETPVPEDFRITDIYPNPFNPQTNISFVLKKDQNISLNVYDSTGRLVSSLIRNSELKAGMHSLKWSGGEKLSSGIYFLGLKNAEGITDMKKMTILK